MTTDAVLAVTGGVYDMQIGSDGDIMTDDFFDTSILVSLFAERRASPSEVPESHRRRGWIGNESTPEFEIGSKLWLFEQARITRTILNGVNKAALESLQWLIDDGYALDLSANTTLNNGSVALDVKIERHNSKVEHRFHSLWQNTGIN